MPDAPQRQIATVALVVRDYDEAIAFFVGKLGFALIEDTPIPEQNKRWVVVAPSTTPAATRLLLARADDDSQRAHIGDQTGGRVSFFLQTDDFGRDYDAFITAGVRFLEKPRSEPYGKVAVFEDLYGNRWDLLQPTPVAN